MLDLVTESFNLCADEYIELVTDAWDATPLNSEKGPFSFTSKCWQAGPYMLSLFTIGPLIYDIQPVHLDIEGPILVFEKLLSGFAYGERGASEQHHTPGPIYLIGQQGTGKSVGTEITIQEFYVPRELVGIACNETAPARAINPTSLFGKIVHAEWDAVFQSATMGQSKVTTQTFERLVTAIKIALGVSPQREDVRSEARELMSRQIQRFIVQNLESPDLSVEQVLNQHGVSRASLYRMFETYGGIRSFVTNLRASKAILDIWQNENQRGIVRSAGARWGFSTGNDFNRTVRRLYGNSPKRLFSGDRLNGQHVRKVPAFAGSFVDQRWNSLSEAPTKVAV